MKKASILMNGNFSLNILEYLLNYPSIEVVGIILNSSEKRSPGIIESVEKITKSHALEIPIVTFDQIDKVKKILESTDIGVSCLFGHVLQPDIVDLTQNRIINMHPSLLPFGRGSDPIPWAKIEGKPQGVSIHYIEEGLDSGAIVFQKLLETDLSMSAGEIYEIAMSELFNGIKQVFPRLLAGEQLAIEQRGVPSYHSSKELIKLKVINDAETYRVKDFINLVQALTYSDGRTALIRDEDSTLWKITLNLTREKD